MDSLRRADIVVMLLLAEYDCVGTQVEMLEVWGVKLAQQLYRVYVVRCQAQFAQVWQSNLSYLCQYLWSAIVIYLKRISTCVYLLCPPLSYIRPEYLVLDPIFITYIIHIGYLSELSPQDPCRWPIGTFHASWSKYYPYPVTTVHVVIRSFWVSIQQYSIDGRMGSIFMQDLRNYQLCIIIFYYYQLQCVSFFNIIIFLYIQSKHQLSFMKTIKQLKLPLSLQNNPVANKIKGYLETLGPSSGYFSCILYEDKKKNYFLKKDKDFPLIHLDWLMYTLMRVNAKTIITSGSTLRNQKWVYEDSRGTFGDKNLQQLYDENTKDPFNLIVYSKKMKEQEIKNMVSGKYFKFIPLSQLIDKDTKTENHSFKLLAQKVNELQMGPTIYENGEKTLNAGLSDVKEGQKNFAQLVVLSKYHGQMPQKYIGRQYDMKFLNRDFDQVWQSQILKTEAHVKGERQESPVSLQFSVYLRKDKSKQSKGQK